MLNKELTKPVENQKKPDSGFAQNLLRALRVRLDTDYFLPNEARVKEYLDLDRSLGTSPERWIPVGKSEWVHYCGRVTGLVGDRPISSYQDMLFPDVFGEEKMVENPKEFTTEYFLSESARKENPQPIFTGYEGAFKAGNVVLDIASGEAVALTQLAVQFPQTTFIGIDRLYQTNNKVFLNRAGLQLTGDDWRFLKQIPDGSVDTILSCQGVNMWGLPSHDTEEVSAEDGALVVQALQRISKPGTIIRFDDLGQRATAYLQPLLEHDWEIYPNEKIFIARKK